jgi:hypothetical protein
VRPALDTGAANGILLINPVMLSPGNWAGVRGAPKLCWHEDATAGRPPFHYRAMAVGPASVDSGWITATCWQASQLKPGIYQWKVFVRDDRGYMNRTNQRPQAFVVRH